jgi:26S proteasome regulatory subunit T2
LHLGVVLIKWSFVFRERRMKVTDEDFKKSKENVLYRKQEGTPEGLYL